jgi:xylan 1,4-beta-xylosidase
VTYKNPVIPGFHPDPSVCRAGEAYFLAASSFTYFPGVPIFRSVNLADWTLVGNALDRTSQLDLSRTDSWSSLGIYAPTLRHHEGMFWLITTNVTEARATTFLVTSEDAVGSWSEPVTVDIPGIDPDLAWDDDGNCWMHFSGLGGIARARIDPRTGAILDGPVVTWSGSGLQYPEAPHLFQREGIWYLVIAEGGTERGHCVSVARAHTPTGPWEAAPTNPILSHRSTQSPIQNTGHADILEAVDGSWWMVLLGVRPRGMSPGFHGLGRETFLTPVEWVDGWPFPSALTLEMAAPPLASPEPTIPSLDIGRDDFDGPALGPQWVALRRSPAAISSLDEREGWLTLFGESETLDTPRPVFVARRQAHHECSVRARVDAGNAAEAGIAMVLDTAAHYEIGVAGDRIVVRARIGPLSAIVASANRPDDAVVLTMDTIRDPWGPDRVALGYLESNESPHVLAELDGRYLSTEVTGGFLGRTIGLYAVGGTAFVDWFDYQGS